MAWYLQLHVSDNMQLVWL